MEKRKNTKNKKKSPSQSSPFAREIAFVVVILLCILMLLSFFHLCGVVGEMISALLFGLFGALAYLFPIFLLVGGGLWLSNPSNKRVKKKIIYGGLMYVVLAALFFYNFTGGDRMHTKTLVQFLTVAALFHSLHHVPVIVQLPRRLRWPVRQCLYRR